MKIRVLLFLSFVLYSCNPVTIITNPEPGISPEPTPSTINLQPTPFPTSSVNITMPTPYPTPSFFQNTVGDVANMYQVPSLSRISGFVYDIYGRPVENANVKISSIGHTRNIDPTITVSSGGYSIGGVPIENKNELEVSKEGWTTRKRNIILVDYKEDPSKNIFNFGGTNPNEKIYAMQDEPEIESVKINGIQVNYSSEGDMFISNENRALNIKPTVDQLNIHTKIQNVGNLPAITGIDNNKLEIEMKFSEPIQKDYIKNYFSITSQLALNEYFNHIININTKGAEFIFPDDKTAIFRLNNKLISYKADIYYNMSLENKYVIDFMQPFRDLSGKTAIDKKYFRFSEYQINDFIVFSALNY